MFKKSLLALAFASVALTANAGTVKTSDSTATKNVPFAVSNQGLPLTGEYNIATGGKTIDVVFSKAEQAALKTGNFLAISITGAFFADYEVSGQAYGDAATTGITINNNVTLTHIKTASSRKNSATKLYLETVGTANDAATTFSIDDLNLQVISGATEIVFTIAVENESGVEVTGTKSQATSIASLQDQWSVKFNPLLNNEIDVADDRETFVGGATTDTLGLDYTLNGTGTNVNADSYQIIIKGDFTGIASVVAGTAGAFAINTAKTQATNTVTVGAAALADDTVTFTLDAGTDAVAQAERDFTADIEVTYATSKTFVLASGKAAGGFALNSTSATLNFVPFGPNTQLILNATSTFAEAASVDLTYVKADGTTETLTDIGTVAANSVTKLGDIISAAIVADDGEASGKTKITVSVNAPTGTVTYFSGFKVSTDGSRMALEQVTTTEGDAAAIKADLANATDGLTALSATVSAGNLTSTSTAVTAAVLIMTTELAAQTATNANYTAVANADGINLTQINAICALDNGKALSLLGNAANPVIGTSVPVATDVCAK